MPQLYPPPKEDNFRCILKHIIHDWRGLAELLILVKGNAKARLWDKQGCFSHVFFMSIPQVLTFNAKIRRISRRKLKIMNAKLEQAVKLFMDNLEVVNELHNQNDYNRLYNIALIASVNNENIPYDKMEEEFNNAIDERNLNRTRLESAYPEYIHTLTIAYDVINRMKNKQIIIPENFRF